METLLTRKIMQVGTSLGVVIPIDILRALNIERGDTMLFRVFPNDVIFIQKLSEENLKFLKPDVII